MGPNCKVQGGRPVLSSNYAPSANRVRATDDDAPSDQPPDESNGGHEISKGHLDGYNNHTYLVSYGAANIPVGVCNPQKMLQIVMDRGCKIGGTDVECLVKGNWPCDYVDDTAKGGCSPDDEGQKAVRKCSLGIDAKFSTNVQERDHRLADIFKEFALKAMEPPIKSWTVPAEVRLSSWYSNLTEDPLGDGTTHKFNTMTVNFACPASKSTNNCGLASALVDLATAILAIFVPETGAAVLGAVGAAGGVAGSMCQ
ncbi:hypothetical protein FA10DRAFT_288656 [Acaromyces ingoldii]|uniref:Uncharacterized protein n=1 Tax=Acaromyces ingoldii TaxID=215250 RepID=A0A316YIP9_9BASI|nr:hypothetical protein FA10DRAFT_288656 [Acaromyces ingoldii]PWN87963.1 hypothetical protein FA10DRAFT_288656 [Acaromyces ingoldii]